MRPGTVVAAIAAFVFVFAGAVVLVRGETAGFVRTIRPSHPVQYPVDVPAVFERGPRELVASYPDFVEQDAQSIHTITHPPGPLLLLAALDRVWPDHLIPRALVLMALSTLTVVATWFLARRLVGEQTALVAVMLLAVVPAFVLYTSTSVDAALTPAVVAAAAFLVRGIQERTRPAAALAAGAAVAFSSFFTYAAGFIALFGVLYAFAILPWREAVRRLMLIGAGGVAGLLALWSIAGYDPLSSYAATAGILDRLAEVRPARRPWLFWLYGGPAAWLIMAGAPVAGLGLRTLVRTRPPWLLTFLAPLMVYFALPVGVIGLITGELERTLLFAYPIGAIAAASALAELSPESRAKAIRWCLAVGGLQAVALEALLLVVW